MERESIKTLIMASAVKLNGQAGDEEQVTIVSLIRALGTLLDPAVINSHIAAEERRDSIGFMFMTPADYQNTSAGWPKRKALLKTLLELHADATALGQE